jgi:predicted nucleic acid-binding protein
MYILDTNVVSELRRERPHGAVLSWLNHQQNSQIFVSAVTIGEIQAGLEITKLNNPLRAAELEDWLNDIVENFKILPMGTSEFRVFARLMAQKSKILDNDAMIAATAIIRKFIVVTRNEKDFAQFNVPILNPFKTTSPSRRR